MSLPADWVDYVFSKLTLVYGRDFLSRWEGLDIDVVKADWAKELDGYDRHPALLEHAFTHLPERPPTVIEFRRIAKAGPDIQPEQMRLGNDRTPASAEFIAAEVKRLQPLLRTLPRDPRQWARDLVARHESGRRPSTLAALAMARDALHGPTFPEEQSP